MGTICPTCQEHKAYQSVQTADGQPPSKADDILFFKLECGHIWGEGDIKEYMKKVVEIRKEMAEQIHDIQQKGKMAMLQSYKALEASKSGGRK